MCGVVVDMNEYQMKELYQKAIKKWGKSSQIDVAIEECAELIKALIKYRRAKGNGGHSVLEEMADVEIMLAQLKLIFNTGFQLTSPHSKFHRLKEEKLLRLKKRLEE